MPHVETILHISLQYVSCATGDHANVNIVYLQR